jgi:hypothetical protein
VKNTILLKKNVRKYTTRRAVLLQSLMKPLCWLTQKVFGVPIIMTRAFLVDDDKQRELYGQISGCDYIRCRTLGLVAQNLYERYGESLKNYRVAELGVFQGAFAGLINELFPECLFYLYDTFRGFSKDDVEYDLNEGVLNYEGYLKNNKFEATSVDYVLSRMPNRDKCVIREGYFPDSIRDEEKYEQFCFVSLDADLYALCMPVWSSFIRV